MRYADDFVILARYQGPRLTAYVEEKLEAWLGLKINRDKTRIVELKAAKARLDFLGYSFRFDRDLQGRPWRYLNVFPSKKALVRERAKLREIVNSRRNHVPVPVLIAEVNRQLLGWASYFGYGYPRMAFRAINNYVRERLVRHLRRRSQRRYRPPQGVTYYEHLHQQLGLVYL